MADHTYGNDRPRELAEALRALASSILECRTDDELLAKGPELLKRMGDLRSELFHYEVRSTYDTPEVAESRRIIDDVRRKLTDLNFDDEDQEPWRDSEH